MLGFLAEGRRHGVLSERAEQLASNALRLRGVAVEAAMVPWADAEVLQQGRSADALLEDLVGAHHSRLPVLREGAGDIPAPDDVLGYVHQLEVLHDLSRDEEAPPPDVLARIRPLPRFERGVSGGASPGGIPRQRAPDRPGGGGRWRGGAEGAPGRLLGLVSVNDLLERISGEVVG